MPRMTPGQRLLPAMLVALAGVAVGLAMLALVGGPGWGDIGKMAYLLPPLAGLGGFAGGFICAPMFGGAGWKGALAALGGALVSTLIGSALAGSAMLLLLGGLRGFPLGVFGAPVFVGTIMLEEPLVLATWGAVMTAVHLIIRRRADASRLHPEQGGA